MTDWMEQVIEKINGAKVRKKPKDRPGLGWWNAKIGPHTTINGLGKVSSLVHKHNKKQNRKG